MKKLLITFLSIFTAAFALAESPFGFLPEYEQDNNYQNYALYKISHDMFIPYFIIEDSENRPTLKVDAYQSALYDRVAVEVDSQTAIVGAFKEWLSAVRRFIINANRSDEFADIMPVLEKEVKLRKVSYIEHADIIFHFTSLDKVYKKCGKFSVGCFGKTSLKELISKSQRSVYGKVKDTQEYFEIVMPYVEYLCIKGKTRCQPVHLILLHEIGHFFALSDEYFDLWYNHQDYLKTPWRLGMEEALMSGEGKSISCDEADGVINLLDYNFSREHNGQYPARAQKGWQSFCDDTLYQNGKVIKEKTGDLSLQK